ncbi:MAG: hypothetical protein NTV93_18345 [Verrucomicrobia bacterium]|nr:hypothetical protein [Verrucomicrobiota bacterium]
MSESPATPGAGRIIGSIAAILVWAGVHLVLFYLVFASGFFIDLFLRMLRTILMNDSRAMGEMSLAWAVPLQIGMILTGLSGVPGGLAIVWSQRRRALVWTFFIAFAIGVLFEISAIWLLLRAAFSS